MMSKQGVDKHRGLLHVSSLSAERLEVDRVKSFIEDNVGPVGSKVRAAARPHGTMAQTIGQIPPPRRGILSTHSPIYKISIFYSLYHLSPRVERGAEAS